MSRIDELIQELCPSGVEYEAIGNLIVRSEKMRWDDLDPTDKFRYIDLGTVDRVTHSISDTETITKENAPSRAQQVVREGDVLFGTTRPMLKRYCVVPADFDGQVASTGFCVLRVNPDRILTNFLFHLLGTAEFYDYVESNERGASYPAIPDNVVKRFRIPVPPLEVQREIVRVLDKFTQLEAELEAELEARRAQYEHYRAGLLKFDLDQVDSVTVLDGFETRNGYTPAKSDPTNWTNGTVPWFRMEDIRENGRVLDSALQTIPEKAVKGGRYFPANSLIFATSATIGEHALITVPFMSNQRFTAIWPKQDYADRFDMKFLFYYGFVIDEWCRNNTTTSSFASVDMVNFKRLQIPIPPMEEQKCVANQLDHFDALVNDISIGLPAELATRRKQYEYYRDRLLTFKEEAV